MLTTDQKFAVTSFEQIKADVVSRGDGPYQKKYGSMAHKLPVLIRTAGLAQALQFVEARTKSDDAPEKKLLTHLAQALGFTDGDGMSARERLLEKSRTEGLGAYMRLTQQSLAALLWYKRFAQSVLNVEAGEDDEGAR
ncbi:MAG: type III-B CRISPR module-associated protein Cmr5 [Acidobacteria bacterium]|nr:type III-B CRISPR module-associated protein Cmr5 [Acidobacteriota bacterium]